MLTAEEIAGSAGRVVEVMQQVEEALRVRMVQGLVPLDASLRPTVLEDLTHTGKRLLPTANKAVQQAITGAATTGLTRDEVVYAAARTAGLIGPYTELADSMVLRRVLQEGVAGAQQLTNLVMTSAVQAAQAEYVAALDTALLQVATNVASPQAVIRQAVRQIAANNTVVTYRVGDETIRTTIYSAVRRNVVTAANQTTLRMQEARLMEVGAEYVEVTAHAGARPDHAEWQGQVYKYADLPAATGYGAGDGLGGWNCGHSFFPYFPGIMQPLDTGFLDDRDAEEDYALSQRQRLAERNVRLYQGRANIYRAAGEGFEADVAHNKALATKWRGEAAAVADRRGGAVRADRQAGNLRDLIAEDKVAAAKAGA